MCVLRWVDALVTVPILCRRFRTVTFVLKRSYTKRQEGPAIRTTIVTKERCEPAGRELVSVRVQAGAKSVVPA